MIEQPSLSDDFTFPTVTAAINSPPHFRSPAFSSPSSSSTTPFWFVSASAAPEPAEQPPESKQGTHRRRSFTEGVGARVLVSTATYVTRDDDGEGSYVDEEERMDMLWEDLNDDLGRNGVGRKSSAGGSDPPSGSVVASMDDLYCLRSLKMSKSNGVLTHRRTSLLVILKIMKKLFLLHNSHNPKRI